MLSKILETLYSKVFINIIVQDSSTQVYVEVSHKDEIVDRGGSVFETTSVNSDMYEFINDFIKMSPFYYISILDKSPNQGAIPTCDKSDINKYIGHNDIKQICSSNKWSSYTLESELKELKYEYRTVGLDFIFSPFNILANFFKDKIDGHLAIFLLVEERNISLAVFENNNLMYAKYLDIHLESEDEHELIDDNSEDDLLLDINTVDLEDIDLDEDDALDDFSDIEDLDSELDIEEFSEAQDIEEIVDNEEDEDSIEDGLNQDYRRFTLVQNAINDFYKDDRFDSEFIETIYVADTIGVSSDLKKYFEEEMFLSVIIRKMELALELSSMAQMEDK